MSLNCYKTIPRECRIDGCQNGVVSVFLTARRCVLCEESLSRDVFCGEI
jgi:hypothetical protein